MSVHTQNWGRRLKWHVYWTYSVVSFLVEEHGNFEVAVLPLSGESVEPTLSGALGDTNVCPWTLGVVFFQPETRRCEMLNACLFNDTSSDKMV
jgi:hypothetical protein